MTLFLLSLFSAFAAKKFLTYDEGRLTEVYREVSVCN
jgi:hypothetical protein